MVDPSAALSEISSHLVRKAVLETIEDILQTKNFKLKVTSASKAGENNFIGIIHRITFHKLDEDGNENGPATNLILKVAPQNLLRRSQFVVRPAFEREIYSYEKVKINSVCQTIKLEVILNEISFLFCRFYLHSGILSNQNSKPSIKMGLQSIQSAIERSNLISMKV